MSMDNELRIKKTPFYNKHVEYGAKIVPFAGYLMPIQYTSIIEEHRKVRESVGVFDVSHMGEFIISDIYAEKFLNSININDVSELDVGQVQYSAMCYQNGGIVDDLLVYRIDEETYLLVINAANIEKDWNWLQEQNTNGASLYNASDEISQLAVQGPNALKAMQKLTATPIEDMEYYTFKKLDFAGVKDRLIHR